MRVSGSTGVCTEPWYGWQMLVLNLCHRLQGLRSNYWMHVARVWACFNIRLF